MNDQTLLYAYFFVGGALLLLVLLGLVASAVFPGLDKRSKRFFISSFSILLFSIVAYVIDLSIYTDPELSWAGKIISFIETLLPSALMPFLTAYVLLCCVEKPKKSVLFYVVLGLCAVLFVLLVTTQFTNVFYYFTTDNRFVRGKLYPILIVPMIALIVSNLVEIIIRRKRLGKKYFIAFLIYLLPLLIAMTVQAFVSDFLPVVIAVSISAHAMFGIIMADQVEQYLRQQREIADQRASIAVLQMRPHFIYNTMTSIYYLCEQDAQKAQQVTLDFTTYLRKNFNAIAGREPIPFAEELAHTRAYLAVEQAQYDDRLFVEYDTPHLQFRVPPLTLQPIVENSVKYGMDPDAAEPLRICIKTRQTEAGSVLIVEDNGPGILPQDNGEPHLALGNICERLSSLGATLTVAPAEPRGTLVTILLPDQAAATPPHNN